MKRIFIVLLALLPMFVVAQNTKKVAILETVDREGAVPYGIKLQLRTALTYAISEMDGYEGFDRVDMASIMGEHNFQRTGMVSDEQIKKLGEMTGASYILIAEAAKYDDSHIIITAKILNVETAGVANSARPQIAKTEPTDMNDKCTKLANSLFAHERELQLEKERLRREEEQRIAEQKRKEAERIAEQKRKEAEAEAERKRKEEMKNRSWRDLVKIGTSNAIKKYSDGGWYIGGFDGGEKEGYGMCGWSNGDLYIGNFEDNHRENSGTYIAGPDESRYLLNCPNGFAYVGWWRNGNKDDTGTVYNRQGKLIYYGEFRGNAPKDSYPTSGYSEYTFNVIDYDDGAKYVGEMYNGKRHGKGMYIWNDGRIWYGKWKDGQRNGYGIYIYEKGAKYQKGNWIGDTKQ